MVSFVSTIKTPYLLVLLVVILLLCTFHIVSNHYHPQRSWGKVIFSQASVILFTGGVCLSACWDITPPGPGTPLDQAPPRPGIPPGSRPSWPGTPLDQASPQTRHPPRPGIPPTQSRAYWEIRSTSGRYASYWNAILVSQLFAFSSVGVLILKMCGKKKGLWHRFYIIKLSTIQECQYCQLNLAVPSVINLISEVWNLAIQSLYTHWYLNFSFTNIMWCE